MTTDDELTRDLRALADDVVPTVTVSTHRVLPRARRRRRLVRDPVAGHRRRPGRWRCPHRGRDRLADT